MSPHSEEGRTFQNNRKSRSLLTEIRISSSKQFHLVQCRTYFCPKTVQGEEESPDRFFKQIKKFFSMSLGFPSGDLRAEAPPPVGYLSLPSRTSGEHKLSGRQAHAALQASAEQVNLAELMAMQPLTTITESLISQLVGALGPRSPPLLA